jgi:threonine dehydratase
MSAGGPPPPGTGPDGFPTQLAMASRLDAAARRLSTVVHRTPVMTSRTLDQRTGAQVFLKCENFQRMGAFKFRGAYNTISRLAPEALARGVIAFSSGNHAQAVALVARLLGAPAVIVMPSTAPRPKLEATRGYGAELVFHDRLGEEREPLAARLAAERGLTLVPPFDHPDIIAGQGTAALELLEQVPDLDAIVVPVGGGGLLSGTCIAAKALRPVIRLYAAEPAGADDTARSMAAGTLIPQTAPHSIADGLLTSLGALTWPIIRDHVDRVLTVGDAQIVAAMRLAWERAKLLIEPSAAVALAAVLSDEFKRLDGLRRVGVMLSGGNVDLDCLPW